MSFEARLDAFALRTTICADTRTVSWRAAIPAADIRRGTPVILLHGIGSGSASWLQQLETLGTTRALYAWDAPGYGASTPVADASPLARDYAHALHDWLDELEIARAVLVGHSLGAIMAAALARRDPDRVAGLLLISPAAGYGAAAPSLRVEKRDARLDMLAKLGPAGLATQRSANMLSAHASDEARAWVEWNMARIVPQGYAQATHLLANADLASDMARFPGPIAVAVGAQDAITPPDSCRRIAEAARTELQLIPRAGHVGYIEQADAYASLIESFCTRVELPS